jgi:cellulase/cellobiase CelA1
MRSITMPRIAITALSGTLLVFAGCSGSDPSTSAGGGGGSAQPCSADQELYKSELRSTVESRCIQCHVSGGAAAGTGFLFAKGDDDGNLATLWKEAAKTSPADDDKPLLLLKPTGTASKSHGGGAVITQGSSAYNALVTVVGRATHKLECSDVHSVSCEVGVAPASNRLIRRLSALEYQNTLADLLGVSASVSGGLPSDTVVNHFDNNQSVLLVSEAFADKVRIITENVIKAINVQSTTSCKGGTADEACANDFAHRFGGRAFRRPLSDAEVADFMAIYKAIAAGEGFDEGVRWMIAAMLQSPYFLYRTELGSMPSNGAYTLTPHEIAAELSYTFWQTTPDDALIAAAADGSLLKPEVILAQAKRLLADPRSTVTLNHFVDQWLAVNQLPSAVKDSSIYPAFTPAIQSLMRKETFEFFSYVGKNGVYGDLFTADYTFLNADLATYYGQPAPTGDPSAFQKVTLTGGRGGILTQGSFLVAQSRPTHTSPTSRGKLVREMILGEPVPPPPPNVNTNLTDVSGLTTMREKLSAHASDGACVACHQRLDPIGFGFEGFESDGRAVMAAIDTSGEVIGSGDIDGPFNGPSELQKKLGASPEAQRAFALHWFRYVYGVEEDGPAKCSAAYVQDQFTQGDQRIAGLLQSLVQITPFVQRTAPGAIGPETPTPDPGPFDPGPAPAAPGGADPTGVTTTLTYQQGSPWATGYCKDATTTNNGSAPVAWTATVPMLGYTLTNSWSSTVVVSGTDWIFSGEGANAVLAPKASITWGFCTQK